MSKDYEALAEAIFRRLPQHAADVNRSLVQMAEFWQLNAVEQARREDPHRIPAFVRRFAQQPERQMCLRYLPVGRVRVSLWLIGAENGQEVGLEIGAEEVTGPGQC